MKHTALRAILSSAMVLAGVFCQTAAAQQTPVQQTQAADPLETRVTISFQAASATDVLRTLATAAGLSLAINGGSGAVGDSLLPVTIAVTNVKLRTVLDAVCDNASCSWQLSDKFSWYFQGNPALPQPASSDPTLPKRIVHVAVGMRVLTVTPLKREFARELPKTVSLTLRDTPVSQAFAVLGNALNVQIRLPENMPATRVNLDIKDASTAGALKVLCEVAMCSWSFDPSTSTLSVSSSRVF